MEQIGRFMRELEVRPWFADGKERMRIETTAKGLGLPSTLPILAAVARHRDFVELVEGEGTSWILEGDIYFLMNEFDTPEAKAMSGEMARALSGNSALRQKTADLLAELGVTIVKV